MNYEESQSEEREVLESIYDGDPAFKQLSPTVYQYKYGENDSDKSFLLEIQWGPKYPEEKPTINMETFYNRNVVQIVKDKVIELVSKEAEQYLGEAMTYSLLEFVKEHFDEIIEAQPEQPTQEICDQVEKVNISNNKEEFTTKKPPKKEQLSKAQKRRQWDRVEAKGEKPRGWDWVDVVKHLSQTGPKEPEPSTN